MFYSYFNPGFIVQIIFANLSLTHKIFLNILPKNTNSSLKHRLRIERLFIHNVKSITYQTAFSDT